MNLTQQQRCNFKLKRIIYTYTATQLITIKERQILAHVFMKMDKDNDGLLSIPELFNLLEKIYNKHKKDFFKIGYLKDEKIQLSLEEVKAQMIENIGGESVTELEFSDFIVNAID